MDADDRMLDAERSRLFKVAVCIPTIDRPTYVQRALLSLLEQERTADIVLVVDASADDATEKTCRLLESRFAPGVLVYDRCAPGLPRQRCHGIDRLRRDEALRYICFIDDDMVLEPEYLACLVDLMESDEGRDLGGVSGYDLEEWGRPFGTGERIYHRLGLFDGDLRPGRWLYCGYFLELDRLELATGTYDVEFLPGNQAVWRSEVFDHFRPPIEMEGYALGEDKHFSVRAGTGFRLAVHSPAGARHRPAPTGRPRRLRFASQSVRMTAVLLRDCDPQPTLRRYLAFLAVYFLLIPVYLAGALVRRSSDDLRFALGYTVGWLSCVVRPPRRTRDALVGARKAR